MIEVKTYDELLAEFLRAFPEEVDTRVGSLAYIVASVSAMKLRDVYEELETLSLDAFGITASGINLESLASWQGLERRGKTKAVVKITGGEGLVVGDTVKAGELEYLITMQEDGYLLAECTTEGTIGNSYAGEVVPVNKPGIEEKAIITGIVALGEEEEDDESLRKRYLERVKCPICTGNMSYYREVIDSITGVGGRKVTPSADGLGVVKVVITDSEYEPAGEDLIKYVKEQLDPEETSGQGCGMVPVGHSVQVETVEKVNVDIVVESWGSAAGAYYDRFLRSYLPRVFQEINKTWDGQEKIVLRDRVIEDAYFKYGATDVNVISINGNTNRITLEPNQILGDVTINGA